MRFSLTSSSSVGKPCDSRRAFSLVEVVVAVGIFAIAIVSIIGLMIPINRSVAEIGEGDDAARVAGVVIEELQKFGYASVRGFINSPPPADNRLHSTRDGKRVGQSDTSLVWDADGTLTDEEEKAQQFFEINLTRNTDLSPAATDADSAYLAYFLELRWPAHTGQGVPIGDRSQQSVLIIPAVVNR